MGNISTLIVKIMSLFITVIMTTAPQVGVESREINNKKDDCLLNVQMISDTHISSVNAMASGLLESALENITQAQKNVDIDLLLVNGDITDEADEESLAKYYEIIKKYSGVSVITTAGNHDIGHADSGDDAGAARKKALANFIRYSNDYYGTKNKRNYYSMSVNGYKFIVLGDEVIDGGHWDGVDLSKKQLRFLKKELAEGTKNGKPVFVCCHWPVDGINGQELIYPDSGIDLSVNNIKSVMEKYENVFYISGHMHSGVKSFSSGKLTGLESVEKVNGVTYISLPSFGLFNRYGVVIPGTGMQMEVYEDEIIIRSRNLVTNKWYTNSAYRVELD